MTLSGYLKYPVFVLLAVVSLWAAYYAQQFEARILIYVLGFIGIWLITVLLFRPSVYTTLLFIAVVSLKPNIYIFYICLGLLLLSYLAELAGREKTELRIPYPVFIAALLFAGIQAMANAMVFTDGFEYFATTILVPVLTIVIIANADTGEKDLEIWSRFIIVVGFILGFIGIAISLLNPMSRVGSLWHTAMTINGFYILAFFLAMGAMIKSGNKLVKYILVFIALIIFGGMLYTYTRITLAAVAFGFFLLMLRLKNLRKLFFLFIILTPLIIPSSMLVRLERDMTTDLSLVIRLIAWYHALIQISRHFLLGIGFNTWKHIYTSWVPYQILYASHPHNAYLRVFVETGVFGFLAYFGIIAAVLVKFYRNCVKGLKNEYNYAVFVSMVTVLFACLTDVFIQQIGVSLPFWITLALMYKEAVRAEEKAKIVL